MKFLTDNFFTEAQKAEMLGSAYPDHVREQLRGKQLEQTRQHRLSEMEQENLQRRNKQHEFDKNLGRVGFAVLALIVLFVVLTGGLGSLPMSGNI